MVLRKLRQLLTLKKPTAVTPVFFKQKAYIDTNRFRAHLSELLNIKIKTIKTQFQATGHTGNVHKIEFLDYLNNPHEVIIKKVENSSPYLFYKDLLEPFNLDSPQMYGHIKTEDGLFLVMEYIPHKPISWTDENRFKQAVNWLVKKDTVIQDNFNKVRELACVDSSSTPVPLTYRIDDCINIVKKGVDLELSSLLSRHFLQGLMHKQEFLHERATSLSRKGRLTVSHYDFQMNNILFASGEKEGKICVIDWCPSKIAIGSVCMDLVGFIHGAPKAMRQSLIQRYRAQIDFENFETTYDEAELLIDLSELAWMIEVMIDGQKDTINPSAFELQARKIQKNLISSPQF